MVNKIIETLQTLDKAEKSLLLSLVLMHKTMDDSMLKMVATLEQLPDEELLQVYEKCLVYDELDADEPTDKILLLMTKHG